MVPWIFRYLEKNSLKSQVRFVCWFYREGILVKVESTEVFSASNTNQNDLWFDEQETIFPGGS